MGDRIATAPGGVILIIDVHRRYRNVNTGEVSNKITDLIGNEATVRRDFATGGNKWKELKTLFKEIDIVPYTELIPEDLNFKFRGKKISKEEVCERFIDALTNSVKNHWDRNKFHVVQHSMGVDSTALSCIIKKLYDSGEIGGKIFFMCYEPEGIIFRKIMEHEGWPEENYGIYNEGAPGREYSKKALTMSEAWKMFDCVWKWPMWNRVWAVEEFRGKGIIPMDDGDLQYHGAGGVDELVRQNPIFPTSLYGFLDTIYYHVAPSYWEGTLHVMDSEVLRLLIENDWGVKNDGYLALKRQWLGLLDPDIVELPNSLHGLQIDYRRITPSIVDRMISDYKASWYGRNIDPDIVSSADDIIQYSSWYGAWSAAVITEHLINEGISLKVE